MDETGRQFIEHSRRYLMFELLPRIPGALADLPEEDIWWRPNEASNSIGNLLLHLQGNVRQWLIDGVTGTNDRRDRQAEFDHRDPLPLEEMLRSLSRTVAEADAILGSLDPSTLLEQRSIQGRNVTVMEAIYHVVEHFSMHTGQITYIAKLRLGRDLRFYEVVDGVPRPRWEGRVRS
jgi:uncharacterized damage-inducible protein DinB